MDRINKIKKNISVNNGDILFLTGHYFFNIKKEYLSFGIFKKLKTKKNNYVPWMNIGLYNKILQAVNRIYYKWKAIDYNYEKNLIISGLKWLYWLRKSDEVKKDEKFLMKIFSDMKDFNFSVKRRVIFYDKEGQIEKKILVFFNDKIDIPSQYYFYLQTNDFDSFSFQDFYLSEKEFKSKKTWNKILVKDTIIKDKYYFKNKIKKILVSFFNNNYIKEDYSYIIDQKSRNEKDLTNTVELFNDVLQHWLKIIDKDIDFDDRSIINVIWNKLYYNKKIKNVLKEFYVFNFYSIDSN